MRCLILVLLLLAGPAWSAPREWEIKAGHRKALLGLGLPLYTLPEASGATYRKSILEFSPGSRYYQIQYWTRQDPVVGDPVVYCSNHRYALTEVGKPLETQQILAGPFGSLTVSRYKKVCRTGWLKRRGAWVQVESECENLARFGQLLEQFQVTPGAARRAARLEAIRATGLDAYEVPGLAVKLTTIEYDPFRAWNRYSVAYADGLTQDLTQGGIGDVGAGFEHPSRREAEVRAGGLRLLACMAPSSYLKGKPMFCYTEWCKLPKGYLHLRRQSGDFEGFRQRVSRLRRVP
ncbi:MAG: hypothetical protein KF760_34225 [Candidatus Eremiobacteraeota bacterium]|nr:hypothetical protein [Candidatus Eremiobacteraeota bacterium]MCW5872813.1 hypothetical protein [Candidatus Eremiobacteraeota bacterium]